MTKCIYETFTQDIFRSFTNHCNFLTSFLLNMIISLQIILIRIDTYIQTLNTECLSYFLKIKEDLVTQILATCM